MCDRCVEAIEADIAQVRDAPKPLDRLSNLSLSSQHSFKLYAALKWIAEEVLGKPLIAEQMDEGMLTELTEKIRETALIILTQCRDLCRKTKCKYQLQAEKEETPMPPPPYHFST